MRNLIGFLAIISVGALSTTAFATDPPAPSATSSTSTSASTTTDKSANAKTTSTTSDGTVKLVAGDVEADKQLKRLKAAGYKPEMHGGEVVFCRKEAVLGSRFEKKMCNTAEALEQQMNSAQEMASQAQRNSTVSPRGN
jgi:hypothetical protein